MAPAGVQPRRCVAGAAAIGSHGAREAGRSTRGALAWPLPKGACQRLPRTAVQPMAAPMLAPGSRASVRRCGQSQEDRRRRNRARPRALPHPTRPPTRTRAMARLRPLAARAVRGARYSRAAGVGRKSAAGDAPGDRAAAAGAARPCAVAAGAARARSVHAERLAVRAAGEGCRCVDAVGRARLRR